MLFADFRRSSEKNYTFVPCVAACIRNMEHLLRVVEGEESADSFFAENSIPKVDNAEQIVVLTEKYGKTLHTIMERDFPGTPILIASERDAVAEYPGAVVTEPLAALAFGSRPEVEVVDVSTWTPTYAQQRNSENCYEISLILPNLYISNEYFSSKKEELQKRNIRRIINVTENLPNHFPEDFTYLRVPLNDHPGSDIKKHFEETTAFIQAGLDAGEGVLVHCSAGISRSPTIVAAYLITHYGLTCDKALSMLRLRREVVDPNFGFMCTLMMFEKQPKN